MSTKARTVGLVTAGTIAAALTLTGCAHEVVLTGLGDAIAAETKFVNEAEAWLSPGGSPFTPEIGVRLFVDSSDPRQIARAIRAIAPTLLEEITAPRFTLTITAVPGDGLLYADYFDVKEATITEMAEVSEILGVRSAGRSVVEISRDQLEEIAG